MPTYNAASKMPLGVFRFTQANVCFWHKADITTALPNVRFWGKRTSKFKTVTSAFDGEFNRSTQHYSLERSGHGAGAIPPLRAKILDTALVPRALG